MYRPSALATRLLARLGLSVVLVVVAACSSGAGNTDAPGRLRVVATTTVFADLVRQIGGPAVTVESLVPKGGEVHTFDPTPADAVRLAEAEVVIANGLGLDDWLTDLVADAGSDAAVVRLGDGLEGVEYLAAEADGDATVNPHLWLNVGNARAYAARIATALATADPAGEAAYRSGGASLDARLAALDAEIRTAVSAIPAANRRVVSFHEAFPYFAAAYDLEIVGVIVDAPGQDPSAGEIAAVVDAIRESGARAVLAEAQFNADLADTVATEAGVTVVRDLYTDSLGDAPVDTYEGMMRWNADRIVEALR
jgi:ABC-type Zn uptake system ZnuABC Zn-binding protein ZnuA